MNKKLLVLGLLCVGAVHAQKDQTHASISLQLPAHYVELFENFLAEATKVADKAVDAAHDAAQQFVNVADKAIDESVAAVEKIKAEIKADAEARREAEKQAKIERIIQETIEKFHALDAQYNFVDYAHEHAAAIGKLFARVALVSTIGTAASWGLNELMNKYIFDFCIASTVDKALYLGAILAITVPVATAIAVYNDYQGIQDVRRYNPTVTISSY